MMHCSVLLRRHFFQDDMNIYFDVVIRNFLYFQQLAGSKGGSANMAEVEQQIRLGKGIRGL